MVKKERTLNRTENEDRIYADVDELTERVQTLELQLLDIITKVNQLIEAHNQ